MNLSLSKILYLIKIKMKVNFNHKDNTYELKFVKKKNDKYFIEFGIMRDEEISYKQTNLFHQYAIFDFLIKSITNFLYNNKINEVQYQISKKMNNINEYILKKCLPIGFVYESFKKTNGNFKVIIKNDEVFTSMLNNNL